MVEKIRTILDYWFEGVDDTVCINKKENPFRKWFISSQEIDDGIHKRFEGDLMGACQGSYASWEKTIHGRLALILLFDQFSRNIFRGTAQMFAYDFQSLNLTLRSIDEGMDQLLQLIERIFLLMPLMHTEDLKIQKLSVENFERLVEESKEKCPYNVSYYEYHLSYARKYYDIIRKTGYFPHRRKLLNG